MSLYDISLERLDGKPDHLSNYRDQVLLVVNVASHCGFTPQYTGLEALQRKYAARGFQVLAFPCNQFGHQEPGSAETIAEFCESRFAVSFPMFAKTDVNGDQAHPLWQLLKSEAPGILGTVRSWRAMPRSTRRKRSSVISRRYSARRPESRVRTSWLMKIMSWYRAISEMPVGAERGILRSGDTAQVSRQESIPIAAFPIQMPHL
jgi:glutathione peroxidase